MAATATATATAPESGAEAAGGRAGTGAGRGCLARHGEVRWRRGAVVRAFPRRPGVGWH